MSTRRTTTVARTDAETAARLRLVVARLGRTVRQHAAAGLTPSQLSALATCEEHGPLRMSELATRESVGAPVATRVVDSLEKLGFLPRVSDETDRRACLIELTDAGRQILEQLWHARAAVLTRRIERLTPEQSATLVAALPVLETLVRDASV
jgi:DNA-binding MarR family transcriptional regulator